MNTLPACPIPGFRFALVNSWMAVKHAAETNETLFYRAPLDPTPRRVWPRQVFKNGKIRFGAGDVRFTADQSHLGRFYVLKAQP